MNKKKNKILAFQSESDKNLEKIISQNKTVSKEYEPFIYGAIDFLTKRGQPTNELYKLLGINKKDKNQNYGESYKRKKKKLY